MNYNEVVRIYNTERSEFPQVMIANHIGFPETRYFDVDGDGLDHLAGFQTDDGKLLREGMGRIAGRLSGGSARNTSSDRAPPAEQTTLPALPANN